MELQSPIEQFWEKLLTYIDAAGRKRIERLCEQNNERIPVTIAQLGLAPDEVVVGIYQNILNLELISNNSLPDQAVLNNVLSSQFLKARKVLPISLTDTQLTLGMVDPFDTEAIDGVKFASARAVSTKVIPMADWSTAFESLYGFSEIDSSENARASLTKSGWADDETRLKDLASEAPVMRQVEQLLNEGVDKGASDIHVEPSPNVTRIRYRVDGQMLPPEEISPEMATLITSRVKVMCDVLDLFAGSGSTLIAAQKPGSEPTLPR